MWYDDDDEYVLDPDDVAASKVILSGTDVNGFTIKVWHTGPGSITYSFSKEKGDLSKFGSYKSSWWQMSLGEQYMKEVFDDLINGKEPHPNYRYGRSFSYDLNPNHYRD